jgi:hypothetical protein
VKAAIVKQGSMMRMNRRRERVILVAALLALALFLPVYVTAQDYLPPGLIVTAAPYLSVAFGEYDDRDVSLFGAGAELSALAGIGGPLYGGGRVGVTRNGFRNLSSGLTMVSVYGSAGIFLSERPSLGIVAEAGAGFKLGLSSVADTAFGIGVRADVGADSAFGDRFRVGARLGYEYWVGRQHGITLSVTAAFVRTPEPQAPSRPEQEARPQVVEEEPDDGADEVVQADDDVPSTDAESFAVQSDDHISVTALHLERIFPVFYKYYNKNPLGEISIRNDSRQVVREIEVAFNVPGYMDAPRRVAGPDQLLPGASVTVPVTALFADTIMNVTTATVATAQIAVMYEADGEGRTFSLDEVLDIAERNAMTWDDNRKAAAFVTYNDPALQIVARGAASVVRDSGYALVNEPLRYAMGIYEALRIYGLQYIVDPKTPYVELSRQEEAIDYLQFPGVTIQVRGGDCDDLSICYAAALQAVGYSAAFVTVPGHIFAAVDTGLTPQRARHEFSSRIDDLIVLDDKVWIPVEMTILSEGFLQAWERGAKQWREYAARGEAELYPVSVAASVYEPAGLRDDYYRPTPPDPDEVRRAFRSRMNRYIDLEILPQVAELQEQIARSNNDPRQINRLGVLYARYGLNDRARTQFELILEASPRHIGALVNLGNLDFLEARYEEALDYYTRAEAAAPENATALLGVARANHELENYGSASRAYIVVKELDPALADRFSYLDFRGEDAARAAELARVTDLVVWEEEDLVPAE